MKFKLLLASFMLSMPVCALRAQGQPDNTVLSIERNSRDNTPRSVVFAADANWRAADAQKIFERYLGLRAGDNEMRLASSTTTRKKLTTYRYFQWYKGHKVADGAITLTAKDDRVRYMTGNFFAIDADMPATPGLAEPTALSKALAFVGADKYKWQDADAEQFIKNEYHKPDTSYYPHGELMWVENYRTGTGKTDGKLHLAYRFDIYAETPLSRQHVYVDAATGAILFSNPLIKHTAAVGGTLYSGSVNIVTAHIGANYRLYDSTRGNGVVTRNMRGGTSYTAATDFTTTTNIWPGATADSAAIDAHWAAERVYDYWDTVHARLSWDNLNGQLKQFVHYNTGYDNAFWDGTQMTYGDGSGLTGGGFTPLVSLDVTAHEIGHGVCEATCNLNYVSESGGLNEAFSDCWGATIENWANPLEADRVPKNIWKIGEEIGGGSPLRSMETPNAEGQPDTYRGTFWYNTVGCTPSGLNDNCGVHTNSGVLNKWYNLVVVGGTGVNDIGNSYAVTGIGMADAADILYQTELALVSSSEYADCRTASINAAVALFGPCSPQEQAVTNAWYAVGVGFYFVPCVPQIRFTQVVTNTTENANSIACPASRVLNIPIKATGPAIFGGSPVITVSDSGGTAINGVHYSMPALRTMTFTPGDTTTHYFPVTIFDNGALADNKDFYLRFTMDAAGTTTIMSPTNRVNHIFIVNDDKYPELGGTEYHQVRDSTVLSNRTSPFLSSANKAHTQYLLSPAEMLASGLRPNVPVSQLAFKVAVKNSTQPFTAFTVSMGNTGITNLSSNFITTGLTTVYTGDFSTYLGWDSLDFTTPFVWDGTSYVVVDVCFTNTSASASNDRVAGASGASTITAYNSSTTAVGSGCDLPYSALRTSTSKPIMRFKQVIAPAVVETVAASTRTWTVRTGQEVYFYAPTDTGVMVGLKSPTLDLGCVNTTLTAAGVGFTPLVSGAGVSRSLKEFSISPDQNATTTNYTATFYFTNAELGGASPSSLYIMKTDAATDAAITTANSQIVTPTLVRGANYTGFTGRFTGLSRYFLVDGILGVSDLNPAAFASIRVDNNPFTDKISVSYSFAADAKATARLYDVTGRVAYSSALTLAASGNKFVIDCSGLGLAPGAYILQVVTPSDVYNQKLIKQ